MNRPDQERIAGSRPSVPPDFYWGMIDVDMEPASAAGPLPLRLPAEEEDQPTAYRFQHTTAPVCAFCGDKLTIVDSGDVCRQCRLEGRNA